jgi:16S rRNA (cytosine967-C5)-methyltransferase
MRFPINILENIELTLFKIFVDNKQADDMVKKLLSSNPKWGSRDRKFIAKTIYDIVRYKRFYESLLTHDNKNDFFNEMIKVYLYYTYPNDYAPLCEADWKLKVDAHINQSITIPAIKESFPDWMVTLGSEQLGAEKWELEMHALNQEADVYIRVNTLKTTKDKLKQALAKEQIEAIEVEGFENALQLKERKNIQQSKVYLEGWFEIQDLGSQKIVEFLDPKPNTMVMDMCAGAGGKSLYIAAKQYNTGQLIACDVEPKKLEQLKIRASRASVRQCIPLLLNDLHVIQRYQGKAAKVLIDAPCSGIGVLKRNPDDKWKLSSSKINQLVEVQQQVLTNYAPLVQIGGEVVYATCSILPLENENQIDLFLKTDPRFEKVEEKTLYPSEGTDGFYMAKIKRIG